MAFSTLYILDYFKTVLEDAGLESQNIIVHEPYRDEILYNLPSASVYLQSETSVDDSNREPRTNVSPPNSIRRVWQRNLNIRIDLYCNIAENNNTKNVFALTSEIYRNILPTFDCGTDTGTDYTDWMRSIAVQNITINYPSLYSTDGKIINKAELSIRTIFYEYKLT